MGTPYKDTCGVEIYKKASMFKIDSDSIDGNDVEQIYYKMKEIVQKVKKECKPAFLELKTYRVTGHSAFDNRPYRTQDEINFWKSKDPLENLKKKILKSGVNPEVMNIIAEKINNKINEAERFAVESNFAEKNNLITDKV